MIKLSRLADYSIVLMTQLAARPGTLVQAPDTLYSAFSAQHLMDIVNR